MKNASKIKSLLGISIGLATSVGLAATGTPHPSANTSDLQDIHVKADPKVLNRAQDLEALEMKIGSLNASGGNTGGGGDPEHVQKQASKQRSGLSDQLKALEIEKKLEAEQQRILREKIEVGNIVKNEAERALMYLSLFEIMKYPFTQNFKDHVTYLKVSTALSDVTGSRGDIKYGNISVNNSLDLNGHPITFLSYPNMNNPNLSTLVVNKKLLAAQAGKIKPWALTATIFHEGLRLQNIEGSDSYPYTTEFASALRDAFENNNFWELVNQAPEYKNCTLPWVDYLSMFTRSYLMLRADFDIRCDPKTKENYTPDFDLDRTKSLFQQSAHCIETAKKRDGETPGAAYGDYDFSCPTVHY